MESRARRARDIAAKILHRMRFATRKSIVAAALLLSAGAAAQPAAVDIFTAYAVPVDAEAATAAEAREAALATGQSDALEAVLKRLTLAEDWARLPRPSAAELAPLVDSIQVRDEKTSSVRYLAELTVEFKPDEVRRLLRESGLPYTESRARPSLVLPIYRRGGEALLFEHDNPWLAAWAAFQAPPASLFPLVVPLGDLQDVAGIDAARAATGDEAALAAIKRRYGATNVVAVAAQQAPPGLRLELQWYGPDRTEAESLTVSASADEAEPALLARAAAETASWLEQHWKRQTLWRADGAEQQLSARLPIQGLADWVAAQRLLRANGMIRRFEVASITSASVQLSLHFQGAPEQLALSLAQNDLALVEEAGGWVLRLRR